ncbi:MAG: 2-isopropylmalate synthase [Deltaproteobacteria bacterium]|nr:2-isopropylmalate synthase [Deltaproteobacteria bacterium]
MKNKKGERLRILCTTLRDGQQCPGAGMVFEDNLEYARLVSDMGIDVLEAGFPASSALDAQIVSAIASELGPVPNAPVIAALCQLREEQVEKTITALEPAIKHDKARLHVYLPVDPLLMKASLGKMAEDKFGLIGALFSCVKTAREAGLEVQFSPEGYSRMGENFDFTTDLIRAGVEAGLKVINCPDTVGYACYLQGDDYFVNNMIRHAKIVADEYPERDITWSVHCHNDFGLAVANTINAVFEGPARQIEGCFNGIGERAGNAALEQCIMILKHFSSKSGQAFYCEAKSEKIKAVSDFVMKKMLPRQPHWPIVGDNAAKHSAGGHTNAILKDINIYQPFDPAEVGQEVSLLFGPLSGGNHAKAIIEKRSYKIGDSEKAEIAQFIKDLYRDRRKGITDEELMKGYYEFRKPIKIQEFDYSKSSNRCEVILKGQFFSEEGLLREVNQGQDSALAALKKLIDKYQPGFSIKSYKSHSEGKDIDARSVSTIVIASELGEEFEGLGDDRDIEISAMKALVDAENRAYVQRNFFVPREASVK